MPTRIATWMTMPAPLIVDPAVRLALAEALEYWQAADVELAGRLYSAFRSAIQRIEQEPDRGLRVPGLPATYRRIRLARGLPVYSLIYRIESRWTLLFLLRNGRRRPYAPATIQRKAAAAAHRAEADELPGK